MTGLYINDTFYDTDALRDGVFPTGEEWQKELSVFLQEWFNNREFVPGHTSGSTGTSKEIKLLKKDMLASARITNNFFHIENSDNLLLCLSPSYIAGKMMVVRALLANARLITTPPSSHPRIQAAKPVKLAAMVPMQVEELLKSEAGTASLTEIKQLIIGGAPVSPALATTLQTLSTKCFATYGMTETVSHIALKDLNGKAASGNYFALGEVEFKTDSRSCLVIHAPHLQQQEFITNDIVRLSDKFHFEWLGRYDHVINSGGVKLSPETIEEKLSPLIPGRFFITSEPDSRLGEKVVLVIEGEPLEDAPLSALKQGMGKCLSRFEIPGLIRYRKKFRETYSGKVIRSIQAE